MKSDLKLENKTIVFAGGGTGGHLWPLVSIIRWSRKNLGIMPVYFGTGSKLEHRIWRKERVRQVTIPSGKKRNYWSLWNYIDILFLPFGVLKALVWLSVYRPAFVFGKGGYGMMPVVVAARMLGIQIVCHESDIVMGKANRKVLGWGNLLLSAFPSELYDTPWPQKNHIRYVGMPVHPSFYEKSKANNHKSKKTILIFGGSQGAERINRFMADMWDKLVELGEVVHITGPQNYKKYNYLLKKQNDKVKRSVTLYPEVDNLPEYIAEASVVVSRAGATSLWEIIASETPAIVIPLPEAAGDHQRLNALWLNQEFPWITVAEEKKLLPSRILSIIAAKLSKEVELPDIISLIMPDESLVEVGKVINEALVKTYLRGRRHFHLVGDQGVSMKGIAKVLHQMGHKVTGSDIITGGHKKENITRGIDAVVYSSAAATGEAPGKVEIDAAQKLNIPTIKRSKFINLLVNTDKLVAVSGMHGKSTVASMVAHIFSEAGYHPSYFIGVPESSNKGVGASNWDRSGNLTVVEACEYDRSFQNFDADAIVITNIEKEHLDYFKGGLPEIENAFADFVENARPSAALVIGNDESSQKVTGSIESIRPDIAIVKTSPNRDINMSEYLIFGEHNITNGIQAVALAEKFGIEKQRAWEMLKSFRGAKRRLELVCESSGAQIFDDYGHHPTEIKTTIKALKERYPNKKLWVVFQPHQISRTQEFFEDFVDVLQGADHLIITDIYEVAGREKEKTISSEKLVDAINRKKDGLARYIPLPYEKISEYLSDKIYSDDLVLTLGATDVFKVADILCGRKR